MSGKPQDTFWWFDAETTSALLTRLVAAGVGARLKVAPDGKRLLLSVLPPADTVSAADDAPLNKSNICPPICP